MVKYEQDPINGKFYPKSGERFTDEDWKAFCKRCGQKPIFSTFEVVAFWALVTFYILLALKVWGVIW